MKHFKDMIKKHILKVLIIILIIVFLIVQLEKINEWIFSQAPDLLKIVFEKQVLLSLILFILIYVIANILLTPSIIFIFIAGMVYGLFWGTIISIVCEIISATVNFMLGRKIRKRFFIHKLHNEKIKYIKKYIEKHDFTFILTTRYLGFYFDLVSYASGMTKIKYRSFIIATVIGFIPYILIYVYAGNKLMDIKSADFIYSILVFKLILFGVFIIGYITYKILNKNVSKNTNK